MVRVTEDEFEPQPDVSPERGAFRGKVADENQWKDYPRGTKRSITLGFAPICTCGAGTRPGVVLDPFMGSGTTALVARAEGRDFLGCDLNPEYVAICEKRLAEPYTPRLIFDDQMEEA